MKSDEKYIAELLKNPSKVVIVGAGLAGLAAGWRLAQAGIPFIILEKDDQIGGLCKTIQTPSGPSDLTGHVLFGMNKGGDTTAAWLEKKLGFATSDQRERKAYIWGKEIGCTGYPFQTHIGEIQNQDVKKQCVRDFIIRSKYVNGLWESFKRHLLWKFGEGMCSRFFFPYNEKLWGKWFDKLDTEWSASRIPPADVDMLLLSLVGLNEEERKTARRWLTTKSQEGEGYNPRFIYPRNGIQAIPELLFQLMDPSGGLNPIFLNAFFDRLHYRGTSPIIIWYTDKEGKTKETQCSYLVYTGPITKLIRQDNILRLAMMGKPCVIPFVHIKSYVAQVSLSKKWGELLGKPFHWVYFPDPSVPFHRIVNMSLLMDGQNNPDDVRILIEVPGYLTKVSPESLIDSGFVYKVKAFHGPYSSGPAYPVPVKTLQVHSLDGSWHWQQEVNREDWLYRFRERLEEKRILLAGRLAMAQYINMDEAINHGICAAENIISRGMPCL